MQPEPEAIIEYLFRETDGELWIDVRVNSEPFLFAGPFETVSARQLALDNMLSITRSLGGTDMPRLAQ